MVKEYRSKSTIGITINLPNGGTRRVSFSGNSEGKSVFYTDDKMVQEALERHARFGSLFYLVEKPKKPSKPAAPKRSTEDSSAPAEASDKIIHLPFVNLSDAKEYLADRFGVSRTRLRTREDIRKYATLNGVMFDGIDD